MVEDLVVLKNVYEMPKIVLRHSPRGESNIPLIGKKNVSYVTISYTNHLFHILYSILCYTNHAMLCK